MMKPLHERLTAAGHELRLDLDGRVDYWAYEYCGINGDEYHNGPVCVACLERWCEHCDRQKEEVINGCDGGYWRRPDSWVRVGEEVGLKVGEEVVVVRLESLSEEIDEDLGGG